ncbi:hypothetical protein E3U43_015234 [Larimichthys crocea]|uniref:Uncharacterized protein n=1 Tax=Larimichthys crocea TaxID=215358 RepID=A0ACD3RNT5_LARCR|nr:hypothetical protein E3U43_015234 [Larimichthys crocea]
MFASRVPQKRHFFKPQNRWIYINFLHCKVSKSQNSLLDSKRVRKDIQQGVMGVIVLIQWIYPNVLIQCTAFPGRVYVYIPSCDFRHNSQGKKNKKNPTTSQLDPFDIMMTVPQGSSLTYSLQWFQHCSGID